MEEKNEKRGKKEKKIMESKSETCPRFFLRDLNKAREMFFIEHIIHTAIK